MQEQS